MQLDKKRTHEKVTLIYFEFDAIGCLMRWHLVKNLERLLFDKKFKENINGTI